MQSIIRIGLIGDYNPAVIAHQAIPVALKLAGSALNVRVDSEWIATDTIIDTTRFAGHDALWCVPASPYRSMEGALLGIRYARESHLPFLGTCGGFQHAVIEYARNVLDWRDAEHAETSPDSMRSVIAPLTCALVEQSGAIRLEPGTRIAAAYQELDIVEGYHCSYGMNPTFTASLTSGPLRVTGRDTTGDVRAVELDSHPFFVATLFQPERSALTGRTPPLVQAFVAAALAKSAR